MTLLSCSYYTTGVPSLANGKSAKSDRWAQGSVELLNDTCVWPGVWPAPRLNLLVLGLESGLCSGAGVHVKVCYG